ncbi:hypothetical protein [Acidovorax sp. sic0104]|uniref:hypothetical protein n=1 Tax=Acidovorax sp. sic0104 TaxID=2854784 RepID=UPI001C44929A|nr:hypothetical protein [Acidovorax sp. sic0104]MBV7543501.1 hypothetical protein [Acidovorax sp. sic0104]
MPFILFSICLFLIFCALYGISLGVSAVLRLFSRGSTGPTGAACPIVQTAGRRAADDSLGQCIVDLDRLFELQQCGALTHREFEALKHQLMQRAASAT